MSTLTSPIAIEEDVHFYDTDCGGVVHNLAYLRMIEKARTRLFEERLGFNAAKMTETQMFPAVTRTEADYVKPARLGDKLRISAAFESIGKLRLECVFEIFPIDSPEKAIVRCRQTTVLVQMPAAKPCRVPTEWLA